jgi:hypothetical protein
VQLCDQSIATANVTVTVINANFNYSQPAYCQSEPTPFPTISMMGGTFSVNPPGLVFLSTATGAVNLPASTPGTYSITYTLLTPCMVSSSQSLTINAIPAIPTPLASYVSKCGAGQVTFGVIQPPGVTINWYDAPIRGNLLPFVGASVTTNVATTTHYYAEAVSNSSSCKSIARADILVVIKAIPVITNNIFNYSICSGDSIKINLASSIPSSTFQWTAFSNAGTLTGYSNGSGNKIAQKLLNSGPVNDTLTYSAVAISDTCESDTAKFIVVVKPLFDAIAAPSSQTICSNNLITINLSSSNAATTFSWTAKGNYPGLSGYADGSGKAITQTLLNSGPLDGTVTYKVVPQGLGCTGDTAVSSVLVHPLPVPVINGSASLCVGSTGVVYSTQAGMTNYTWVVSAGGTITAGGTAVSNTVTITWNTPGAQTVSVNYLFASGCTAPSSTIYPVTVNPLPGASGIITGTAVLCQGSTGIAYSVAIVANTTSYTWVLAPPTAGTISGVTNFVTINWSPAFIGTAHLSVFGVNSCGNGAISPTFPILVNPNPIVSYTVCTDSITTPNARIIPLREGIPLGGTWSGSGVNPVAGTFNPATAGIGTHTITYTYSNVYSCNSTASRTISVVNPGLFVCGGQLHDVRDNKKYNTVQIGTQCWMSESLNYGSGITSTQNQFDNCTPEKYCFGNNPANCLSYGGFYQWDELMAYSNVSGS